MLFNAVQGPGYSTPGIISNDNSYRHKGKEDIHHLKPTMDSRFASISVQKTELAVVLKAAHSEQ